MAGVFDGVLREPATGRAAWASALAGALAAAFGIALAELVAGLIRGAPSLVIEIGALLISLQPPGAKDVVVELFGTNDKLALNVLVVLVAVAIAAAAGVLAGRRYRDGALVFGAFGLVGVVAIVRDPLADQVLGVLNAAVAVGAALLCLRWLLSIAPAATAGGPVVGAPGAPGGTASGRRRALTAEMGPRSEPRRDGPEWTRRRFLIASAGTLGGVAVAGGVGRVLLEGQHSGGIVSSSRLPAALDTVPPLTSAESLDVSGISPIVVPNADFYRIDTRLDDAAASTPTTWSCDPRHGRPRVDVDLRASCGDAARSALRDDRVRVERGRRATWWATPSGPACRSRTCSNMAGVQTGATQVVGRVVRRLHVSASRPASVRAPAATR